jgi:hypothetical protein
MGCAVINALFRRRARGHGQVAERPLVVVGVVVQLQQVVLYFFR